MWLINENIQIKRAQITMKKNSLLYRFQRLLGIAVLAMGGIASAQEFPTQPVTLLIPYPPGGSADVLARPLLPELQENPGATRRAGLQGGCRRHDRNGSACQGEAGWLHDSDGACRARDQ